MRYGESIPMWQKAIVIFCVLVVAAGAFMLLGQLYKNTDPDEPEPREYRGW